MRTSDNNAENRYQRKSTIFQVITAVSRHIDYDTELNLGLLSIKYANLLLCSASFLSQHIII